MTISEKDRSGQITQSGNGHFPEFVTQLVGSNFIEECRASLIQQGFISPHDILEVLPPDKRTHPDSKAIYFAKAKAGAHRVWISGIPAGSWTSLHSHPGREDRAPVYERYECIGGECEVWIEGRFEKLRVGQTFRVWPGEEHAVKTNGSGAILLIVAENGGFYSEEELHRNRRPAPFK